MTSDEHGAWAIDLRAMVGIWNLENCPLRPGCLWPGTGTVPGPGSDVGSPWSESSSEGPIFIHLPLP